MNDQSPLRETAPQAIRETCGRSLNVATDLERAGRAGRAAALRNIADALGRHRADIVRSADAETGLGETRLNSELTRTSYQCNHFADVLDEGSYLEVTLDRARSTAMGDQPDLRRMLVPIGPVAVFGSSNFPLAFSVPGGDTIASLAAGCPVVIKAHPSHPETSVLCAEILTEAMTESGLADNTLQLVFGLAAGRDLVRDSAIKAVAFTGSVSGGEALLAAIAQRPDPIPFYGELGSLNPVVIMPRAAQARGSQIGYELAQSGTVGNGQFCTKPQLVFLPNDAAGDVVLRAMREVFTALGPQTFLNEEIAESYASKLRALQSRPNVRPVTPPPGTGKDWYRPSLLTLSGGEILDSLTEEVFGPVQIVMRYASASELLSVLNSLPASLTATMHVEPADQDLVSAVMDALRDKAGRYVFNGYPTGVSVSWAQHHGGPWPATNSIHTSVGAGSIRRFLRPVAYQSAPEWILPPELRDDAITLPRRVDGVLHASPQYPQGEPDDGVPPSGGLLAGVRPR